MSIDRSKTYHLQTIEFAGPPDSRFVWTSPDQLNDSTFHTVHGKFKIVNRFDKKILSLTCDTPVSRTVSFYIWDSSRDAYKLLFFDKKDLTRKDFEKADKRNTIQMVRQPPSEEDEKRFLSRPAL
ncbi:MAG: hypothetical protein C5B59_07625 [Bacteroidetes bacterium]|nr:MAG: hypothetical protein C5B59_07625 [Bacteroidota bacterium]